MPLQLPEPDRTPLPRSPLDLVVCQLRFETRPQVSEGQLALSIHEALGGGDGRYPRLEQVQAQAVGVTLGPGTPPAMNQMQGQSGWRCQSAEGLWVVSLMPDHVALETTRYTEWDDFRERLHELLDATAEHIAPGVEQRLGLRYIDRISEVEARSPADWEPYLIRELLGLALHDQLGAAVTTTRQQVLLDLGEGYSCAFTHGFLPGEDERLNYLLDYDLFREGGRAFGVEAIKDALEVLSEDALKLFQASITPALYDFFREAVTA
ncbi:MAG: TIGR04255 family protein [Actinomycetota bacterium]|nr:TIGR04255 family protein [Actinomycetota bacterium]